MLPASRRSAAVRGHAELTRALAQIFFDDNIGHTAAHIVDARDVRDGEPLAFKVRVCAGLRGACSATPPH